MNTISNSQYFHFEEKNDSIYISIKNKMEKEHAQTGKAKIALNKIKKYSSNPGKINVQDYTVYQVSQIIFKGYENKRTIFKQIFDTILEFFGVKTEHSKLKQLVDEIQTIFSVSFPSKDTDKMVDQDSYPLYSHPLSFSSKEEKEILNIADEFRKYSKIDSTLKINNVNKIDKSLHNWIFEINNFSNIIFKMSLVKDGFKERIETIEAAREICNRNNISLIKIPKIKILVADNLYAEEKAEFITDYKKIVEFYPKEKLNEIYKQLTILVCKSGSTDLTPQNYGFLKDGSGLCLFDVEDKNPEDPSYGLQALIKGIAGTELASHINVSEMKEIIKEYAPSAYNKIFRK